VQKLADSGFGGGAFHPGLAGALNFVRSQVGKPYRWAGVGPGGYDCSGLISAAMNVAQGRPIYRRRLSTGVMPTGDFLPGLGPFSVGWFRGAPGHIAGTINGVNVESAGGVGVRMGSRARGATNPLFNRRAHLRGFRRGGIEGKDGDSAYDLFDPRGERFTGLELRKLLRFNGLQPPVADRGASLRPGINVLDNQTGQTEHLRNADLPQRLHPADIEALARAIGHVVISGIAAGQDQFSRRGVLLEKGG
jgi:NlpC/P60 family